MAAGTEVALACRARLTVVIVIPEFAAWFTAADYVPAEAERWLTEPATRAVATLMLERDLVPDELPLTTSVARGKPALAILAEIERGNHDLVVMGRGRRVASVRTDVGRVSLRVLSASSVPVMLVPPLPHPRVDDAWRVPWERVMRRLRARAAAARTDR